MAGWFKAVQKPIKPAGHGEFGEEILRRPGRPRRNPALDGRKPTRR
jgi:hypothetical protein